IWTYLYFHFRSNIPQTIDFAFAVFDWLLISCVILGSLRLVCKTMKIPCDEVKVFGAIASITHLLIFLLLAAFIVGAERGWVFFISTLTDRPIYSEVLLFMVYAFFAVRFSLVIPYIVFKRQNFLYGLITSWRHTRFQEYHLLSFWLVAFVIALMLMSVLSVPMTLFNTQIDLYFLNDGNLAEAAWWLNRSRPNFSTLSIIAFGWYACCFCSVFQAFQNKRFFDKKSLISVEKVSKR
ncbi:MAG: hypothetical protein ACPGVN_04575, partial [Alphaproteobacteria bacterium]